ncbi:MAG: hypothetical protein H7Y13_17180 [Sphingobacteriaceae bacterium]|nr:hypothetical protein [Sphingobacteriaceae bacterium]
MKKLIIPALLLVIAILIYACSKNDSIEGLSQSNTNLTELAATLSNDKDFLALKAALNAEKIKTINLLKQNLVASKSHQLSIHEVKVLLNKINNTKNIKNIKGLTSTIRKKFPQLQLLSRTERLQTFKYTNEKLPMGSSKFNFRINSLSDCAADCEADKSSALQENDEYMMDEILIIDQKFESANDICDGIQNYYDREDCYDQAWAVYGMDYNELFAQICIREAQIESDYTDCLADCPEDDTCEGYKDGRRYTVTPCSGTDTTWYAN